MVATLETRSLKKYFPVQIGHLHRTLYQQRAVDDVSITIESGRTLGLVGESGCGKSTLGRCLLRLIQPTSGEVFFGGEDLFALSERELKLRRRHMQIIFQDPYASLNPRMSVYDILEEPFRVHGLGSREERQQKIFDLLEVVGLRRDVVGRFPHEFSGGQRQRIGIARALTLGPKFIVADEPVSALDVSVQSQILNLIADLQKKFGIAFLFISHNLAVVQHISHRVAVMFAGKIVEEAESTILYREPKHPYTKTLLDANPSLVARKTAPPATAIRTTESKQALMGCAFHLRCPRALPICRTEDPAETNLNTGPEPHRVRCHLYK